MNEFISSGPRKIPEAEKKFGLSLRAELFLSVDEPVNVVIVGREDLVEDSLTEAVSSTVSDIEGVSLFGGVLLSATVYPPDVRSKLTTIAGNDSVHEIILNEPLMPITIPESHFR